MLSGVPYHRFKLPQELSHLSCKEWHQNWDQVEFKVRKGSVRELPRGSGTEAPYLWDLFRTVTPPGFGQQAVWSLPTSGRQWFINTLYNTDITCFSWQLGIVQHNNINVSGYFMNVYRCLFICTFNCTFPNHVIEGLWLSLARMSWLWCISLAFQFSSDHLNTKIWNVKKPEVVSLSSGI
jgi:hypothetical protein